MKKLRLELDELSVDSFETAKEAKETGTVRGHATDVGNTCWDSCGDAVCGTHWCIPTDGNSCQQATCVIYTCQSCAYTCAC